MEETIIYHEYVTSPIKMGIKYYFASIKRNLLCMPEDLLRSLADPHCMIPVIQTKLLFDINGKLLISFRSVKAYENWLSLIIKIKIYKLLKFTKIQLGSKYFNYHNFEKQLSIYKYNIVLNKSLFLTYNTLNSKC